MLGKIHDVRMASCPAQAFTDLKLFTPDVILSDWDMPGMNGGEFCRALRAQGSTVPFIIISGEDRSNAARLVGATASALKPMDKFELLLLLGKYGP